MIRALDTRLLRPVLLELCRSPANSVRATLGEFAGGHNIPVGRA